MMATYPKPYMQMLTANITINGVRFTDTVAIDHHTEMRLNSKEAVEQRRYMEEKLMRALCERVCGELVRPFVRFEMRGPQ